MFREGGRRRLRVSCLEIFYHYIRMQNGGNNKVNKSSFQVLIFSLKH